MSTKTTNLTNKACETVGKLSFDEGAHSWRIATEAEPNFPSTFPTQQDAFYCWYASCGLKHQVTPQEMETPMTYQERYEKTNAWSARRIAKELMLMNGENEIVRENDEQTICDAERQDTATRQLVKPEAKRSLLA